MAIVADSLLATLRRTVFVKPPDLIRELTAMPRALVTFNILNGVISAKPLNDSQELTISMILDGNFAYRWIDLNWSLSQDVAQDWLNRGYLELTNAIRNLEIGATQRHVITMDDLIQIPGGSEMIACRAPSANTVSDIPRYVIQTPAVNAQATPVITFKATNQNVAAGLAGTTNFFASFMEFDIEQAERFPLHWPAMVFQR